MPVTPKDPYGGCAPLHLTRYEQPIDSSIPYFPHTAKEDYNDIRYSREYTPPAQPSKVELPTKEKRTEPVQDPVVPRVKGIGGAPQGNRRSSRLATLNITAKASHQPMRNPRKTSKRSIGNLQMACIKNCLPKLAAMCGVVRATTNTVVAFVSLVGPVSYWDTTHVLVGHDSEIFSESFSEIRRKGEKRKEPQVENT